MDFKLCFGETPEFRGTSLGVQRVGDHLGGPYFEYFRIFTLTEAHIVRNK